MCLSKTVVFLILLMWVSIIFADEGDWLTLEGGGYKIIKLYGLSEDDRLTITLFPLAVYEEHNLPQLFYKIIDTDQLRMGSVTNKYQIEQTTIPGLSVLTTIRRFEDQAGLAVLILYQAFYFEHQQSMWFAKTELNDNLNLLIQYYREEFDLIMKIIGVETNKH